MEAVDTEVLLRFLAACRQARLPGRPAPNVVSIRDGRRLDGYSPATINRRRAAITGLFAFREVRDPNVASPVPKGREARWVGAGERHGLLAHLVRPRRRSALRLRQPAAAAGVGPRRDDPAVEQLAHVAGSGDRRADAVLRAARRRGPRT